MRFSLLTSVISVCGAFSYAAADTAIVPVEVNPAKIGGPAVPAESVDDMLTNNSLRAFSGSTSRWSIASTFNYNGGTILAPFAQDRPNIAQTSATTTKADLDGAVSVKYNINTKNSILAGIGMRWIAPLSTGNLVDYKGTAFDVMNPYLVYQRIYKWLGIQSVLQIQGMRWTQADQTAVGYATQLNIDQENMYAIGSTGVSVGASVWGQYQWFNRSGSYGVPSSAEYIPNLAALQSVYAISFSPIIEYQVSEKVNLRTVFNYWMFEHYGTAARVTSFYHDKINQSFGVGYSVTRDLFLYPNIQFLPYKIQASATNLGLTVTANLF